MDQDFPQEEHKSTIVKNSTSNDSNRIQQTNTALLHSVLLPNSIEANESDCDCTSIA